MSTNAQLARTAGLLALAAILVVGGLLAGRWLQAPAPGTAEVTEVALAPAQGCEPVGQACRAGSEEAGIWLRMGPSQPMTPFPVEVSVERLSPDSVSVEFHMLGMDMGMNRYRLTPADADGKQVWQGSVTLPVCASGRLDWVAVVSAHSAGQVHTAQFGFEAGGR